MYYDEQVINGVLCHRGTPNGEWIKFTPEQLTAKILELKADVSRLENTLDETVEMMGDNEN